MRTVLVVTVTLVGLLLLIAAWALLDVHGGATSRTIWNHTWRSLRGSELGGYLTGPDGPDAVATRINLGRVAREAQGPAVLFLHERDGLSLDTTVLADSLAADGFVVLAPDLHRGRLAMGRPGARILAGRIHDERLQHDLDRAVIELKSIPFVDPGRIAVVGFGFGGAAALDLGARDATLSGVAVVAPGPPVTAEREMGLLGRNGPVLVAYGARDRHARGSDLETFETLLAKRDFPYVLRTLENARGSFVSVDTIRTRAPAQEAWNLIRAFLQSALY